MSLDIAIEKGDEHRKPFTKAKAVSHHCRNHGLCEWCVKNRTFTNRKHEPILDFAEELPDAQFWSYFDNDIHN